MSAPVTNIRIEPTLKQEANEVFDKLGINLSVAVNIFLKAVVREQGMPFPVSTRSYHIVNMSTEDIINTDEVKNAR